MWLHSVIVMLKRHYTLGLSSCLSCLSEEGLCEESYPVMLKRHYTHGLSSCLSVRLRKDCVRSLTQSC